MKKEYIKIPYSLSGRLDKFLVEKYKDVSRATIQRLIKENYIKMDGRSVTSHTKIKGGHTIELSWPSDDVDSKFTPVKNIPFQILFEDRDFLVLEKPPHLLVHPAGRHRDGSTLVEMLMPKLKKKEWPDSIRPGLVHRLDRDTSGVMLFAKNPQAHTQLAHQFAKRQVKKTYVALVKGIVKVKEGTLECKMARHPQKRQRFAVTGEGRLAITKFKTLETFRCGASYVELYPLTGRTHQLRVQLSHYSFPILGDTVYGGPQMEFKFVLRQMLHAKKIAFKHPKTGKSIDFESSLPGDFLGVLNKLRSDS